MKLSDFIALNQEDKKGVLLHHGVLVAKRRTADCMLFLFYLENFYVESVFRVDTKALAGIYAFIGDTLLQPYLESISLGGIIGES